MCNFFATSATLKQPTKGCRLAEIKTQGQMLERCVSLELKTQPQITNPDLLQLKPNPTATTLFQPSALSLTALARQ